MSNRDKFLKALFIIEFILLSLILILFFNDNQEIPTAYVVKEIPKEIDFKTFTKAVCEERADYLLCRDELFVKCNEKEYKIENNSNLIECGNIKINLSDLKVNGSTKFRKEWIETRNST